MLKLAKRACACLLALIFLFAMLPVFALHADAAEDSTMVESTLNFTTMNAISEGSTNEQKAESKQKVQQKLLEEGAFEVSNLFLVGNWETIVNPGGYNGVGYFVQKVEAAEGETIQNAVLNLGYWVASGDPQGYVEVYVSADSKNYTKVWEQKEGDGDAFTTATRRSETIELPVKEGQTVIYVKVAMEHWSTYEGAGVAFSTVTLNRTEQKPVDNTKPPEECTMVTASHNFNGLQKGEVTAEDIGAVGEQNMFYLIDDVPLLSPRNGYEPASATWKLDAAEGEVLNDCVLTIVGRTYFITESVKDDNYLKVYASGDGLNYTLVEEFHSNDNPDDAQRFTVDLTEAVKGYTQAYVKLEWLVFDSPHIFGIRSVTLTGNTAGIDNSGGEPAKMVISNVQSFTSLPVGEADATALNAYKTANLMFGYNKTPLLTAREAGEDAYVTWKLTSLEGETFEDCYLTLIGKVGWVDPEKKDTTSMKISISTDGEKYSEVKELLPGEDQSDSQLVTIDLSAQAYGLTELYIKVYFSSKDDPSCMGLRGMALVANAGTDYELYTPELEDRVITDEEMEKLNGTASGEETEGTQATSKPTESKEPDDVGGNEADSSWYLWVVIGVAAVVVIVCVVIGISRKKKTS